MYIDFFVDTFIARPKTAKGFVIGQELQRMFYNI